MNRITKYFSINELMMVSMAGSGGLARGGQNGCPGQLWGPILGQKLAITFYAVAPSVRLSLGACRSSSRRVRAMADVDHATHAADAKKGAYPPELAIYTAPRSVSLSLPSPAPSALPR